MIDVLVGLIEERKKEGATWRGTHLRSDLVRVSRLGNVCPETSCLCLFLLYSRKGGKAVFILLQMNKITGRNTLHLYYPGLFRTERL